jgi:AraC family ethanolamine operon transcriptional activator
MSLQQSSRETIHFTEGFSTRVATDADVHAANLTGWNQLYDQLSCGRFQGRVSELWMGKLQVFHEVTSHTVRQACQAWPGSWWFGIPLRGDSFSKLESASIDKDAIAVCPGGAEFELLTPDNFEIFGVVIGQEELMKYAEVTEHSSLSHCLLSKTLLHIGRVQRARLQTIIQQILTEVSHAPQLLLYEGSRQEIRASILQAVSDVCCVPACPDRLSSTRMNHRELVSRIREYVLSRRDEPVAVSDLCRDFYVGRRTLQNAFLNVVGMSPASYLRVIRLNGVRRMLRNPEMQVSCVQDAAAEWGFWHLSQFACDYRRLFGELPSDSLRQRSAN